MILIVVTQSSGLLKNQSFGSIVDREAVDAALGAVEGRGRADLTGDSGAPDAAAHGLTGPR
jgi:hypothetical protein